MQVFPFRGLRPPKDFAPQVAAPPYDVITPADARRLGAAEARSFVFVNRPEINLPAGADIYSDEAYAAGTDALARFQAEGWLQVESEPRVWLYAQTFAGHRQVGFCLCVAAEEYHQGAIKKHEKTRPDKEDDRTRHVVEMRAHDEPVFLAYRADEALAKWQSEGLAQPPWDDFETEEGIRHQTWRLSAEASAQVCAHIGAHVPALYVADGHHRTAAAARMHRELAGAEGNHDRFLAVIFPHDGLKIMGYHRVVADPQGRSPTELKAAFEKVMKLAQSEQGQPSERGRVRVYFGRELGWYEGELPQPMADLSEDVVANLDCARCQNGLLEPLFGIENPRTSPHLSFVGGIHGAQGVAKAVDERGAAVGLCLFPTTMDDLLAVSDAERLMPPKSTWFEPKLRSGLFVHTIDAPATDP